MRTNTIRHALTGATAVALAVTLAACGSGDPTGSGDGGMSGMDHGGTSSTTTAAALPDGVNAADVTFATQMIPHHRQAVTMSQMAADQADSPEVKALATQIDGAQGPEIETMSGWLQDWSQPVPAEDAMADHDMSGSGDAGAMEGMMSTEEMDALEAASGEAFDRLWLEMMTRHHEGAITMAEAEVAGGSDAEAKALAGEIATAQAGEIATMKQVLAGLS